MPSSRCAGVDSPQGLQQNARLLRASQLPEDTHLTAHFHAHPPGGARCRALFLTCTQAKTHAGRTLPLFRVSTVQHTCPFYTKSPRLIWAWAVGSERKRGYFGSPACCHCVPVGARNDITLSEKHLCVKPVFIVEDGGGCCLQVTG